MRTSALPQRSRSSAALAAVLAALLLAGCGALAGGDDPAPPASAQRGPDGLYHNAPNPFARPSAGFVRNWSRLLFETKQGSVPVDPIPVQALTRAQLDALPDDANHVVRMGHSSLLFKLRGKYWLVDPMFGERASPFSFTGPKRFHAPPIALQDLPPIEGLILSHDHYDHLDRTTIEYLADRVPRYFVPLGVGARLRDMGVQPERIREFDWWQSVEHAGVKFTTAPAHHFSGRTLWDRGSTLWMSWVIEVGSPGAGQRIFYSGDSGYMPGFAQIGERFGGFDLALIENGAYGEGWPSSHMQPEETAQAAQDLRARVLYPVHNSTFDLAMHPWQEPMERLSIVAAERQIALATPLIGEVLTVGQPRSNTLWWRGLK